MGICPRCAYALDGLGESGRVACPECGAEVELPGLVRRPLGAYWKSRLVWRCIEGLMLAPFLFGTMRLWLNLSLWYRLPLDGALGALWVGACAGVMAARWRWDEGRRAIALGVMVGVHVGALWWWLWEEWLVGFLLEELWRAVGS